MQYVNSANCSPCDVIKKMADFQEDGDRKLQIFAYLHVGVTTLSITIGLYLWYCFIYRNKNFACQWHFNKRHNYTVCTVLHINPNLYTYVPYTLWVISITGKNFHILLIDCDLQNFCSKRFGLQLSHLVHHRQYIHTVHDTENLTFSEEFRGCSARNDTVFRTGAAELPRGRRGTSARVPRIFRAGGCGSSVRVGVVLPRTQAQIFRADLV